MRRQVRQRVRKVASQIRLSTANGYGGTNTKIFRYTNSTIKGTAISYTDSAAGGALLTINESGIYAISIEHVVTAGGEAQAGITMDTAGGDLTTNVIDVAPPTRLAGTLTGNPGGVAIGITASWVGYLNAGQTIRPHGNGGAAAVNSYDQFSIAKVG